ncbi:hypothetical protein [Kordiimonas lacus]|uniref:Uncharacterized protein n=1 Tax=Kordiimonas lacus TaxID=637679 RepID=A0A1G6T0Z2_9PROT|nr:hypothetical protein [Kordiimonas lacus]SDD22830.1 hypothetical protein SAMN04488071_0075 [Kordiimonas lacus]
MKKDPMPRKSSVRVKAFVLLGVSIIGAGYLLSTLPWTIYEVWKFGILLVVVPLVLTIYLTCENCGFSVMNAANEADAHGYEERKNKFDKLRRKGFRLAAFRKHCVNCGQERY